MGFFSKLFGGGSKQSAPSSPGKAAGTGKVTFTDGSAEIVMPMAQVAFTPPAGLAPYGKDSEDQDPANTRVAYPSLMSHGAQVMVTGLIFPKGMTLPERVEWFLSRSPQDDLLERTERKSVNGAEVLFLHLLGRSKTPGKPDGHVTHCYVLNRAGDVVDIYCLGAETHARMVGEAVARTLRLL